MNQTILIVDGQVSSPHDATQQTLSLKLNYRVVMAGTPATASNWVLENRQPLPDLMLLDLSGQLTGSIQAIQQIKSHRPKLPILVLTPYGDDTQPALALRAGADDFLSKPVTMDRLRISIQTLLKIERMSQTIADLERMLSGAGHAAAETVTPSLLDLEGRIRRLKSVEEEAIRFALRQSGGCMTQAARSLGIGRSTLYRRLDAMSQSSPDAGMESVGFPKEAGAGGLR